MNIPPEIPGSLPADKTTFEDRMPGQSDPTPGHDTDKTQTDPPPSETDTGSED